MSVRVVSAVIAFLFLSVVVCTHSTNPSPPPDTRDVSLFVIHNSDISGWTMAPDSFTYYDSSNFNNDVDGSVDLYKSRGMVKVVDMDMIGPDSVKKLGPKCFIMDFQNAANATAMYNYEQTFWTPNVVLPGFNKTVAFAYTEELGSVRVIAHFGKFYLDFPFSVYTDKNQAVTDAIQFISFEKSLIEAK